MKNLKIKKRKYNTKIKNNLIQIDKKKKLRIAYKNMIIFNLILFHKNNNRYKNS